MNNGYKIKTFIEFYINRLLKANCVNVDNWLIKIFRELFATSGGNKIKFKIELQIKKTHLILVRRRTNDRLRTKFGYQIIKK